MRHTRLLTLICLVPALAVNASGQAPDRRQLEFFEKKIRPVLVKSCYKCHSAQSKELGGKLRLDHRGGLLKGGETGPAVVPGKPSASLLQKAIEYRDGLEMPPDKKLPAEVIQSFRAWIAAGAVDPRVLPTGKPGTAGKRPKPSKDLWSLKPVTLPKLPEIKHGDWPKSDIDHFLLARMETAGLAPVGDATPATLLRRLYFDLLGLPPSPKQLAQFQADHSPAAYRATVDRLLESPRFGERWARHWLDVARYAESAGSSRDVLMIWAWRYRNWVIDAVNNDIPYDRFLTEQLAGDLLEPQTPEDAKRLQVATGLLAIGQKSLNGGNIPLDVIDDQLDVIGKTMLGLTIACARCHDHKFDPIPTADYYALAGIFRSTETLFGGNSNRPKNVDARLKVYLVLGDRSQIPQIKRQQKKLSDLQKQSKMLTKRKANLAKQLPKPAGKPGGKPAAKTADSDPKSVKDARGQKKNKKRKGRKTTTGKPGKPGKPGKSDAVKLRVQYATVVKRLDAITSQLARLKSTRQPSLEFAVGVRDRAKVADGAIQVRGEKGKAGRVVPRGFLSVVPVADPPRVTDTQSGRLELAQWLTRADNPLTPRVAVNRIWAHLLGSGLVATLDNFGHLGQPPSHPRLLDWLAHRFVHQHKWSRKALIRELVLTRAYRLASTHNPAAFAADPAARLHWRHNRRRLEAEAIRDAMLAVSGQLDLARPEASQVTQIGEGEVGRNLNIKPLTDPFPHRSVYLPIVRGILPEFLKLFDFPDPSNPQAIRDQTNDPAQALFLLNSPFVIHQSDALATRLLAREGSNADRLDHAFQLTLARKPTPAERDRALAYITTTSRTKAPTKTNPDQPTNQPTDKAFARQRAWSLFCQVLLAGAEFRYLD
jgi:hypothetical protein